MATRVDGAGRETWYAVYDDVNLNWVLHSDDLG